jgi:xylulokinase
VFGGSPVFTPVGDQQASLLGVGLREDEVAVNVGTGGQVARILREFSYGTHYQTRPYFEDLFLATITHLPAGRLVAEYFKIWTQSFKFSFREFLEFSSPQVAIPASIPPLELDVNNKKALVDASRAHMHVPHSLPTELSKTLAAIYARAIEEVDPGGKKKIVFAGGLGSAFADLQRRISKATHREIRVSSSLESTISGLSKLARTSRT